MNVLITGADGQLGSEINVLKSTMPTANFVFTDVADLDITSLDKVRNYITVNSVDAIVNCAAYTAVDKAESDRELCTAVNVTGPENLAKVAAEKGLIFIHTSTDFVFDGKSHLPYKEEDSAKPTSVYGITKLEGEQKVMEILPTSVIVRTSWLYSTFGANFVKTMQRLGADREQLNVIYDQIGSPTYANDLAKAILVILKSLKEGGEQKGIYHYSNEGVASWYDFACAIMELSGIACEVSPIETYQYPTPAPRPNYSVLNKAKIKADFEIGIPHWRASLKKCISALNKNN